MVGITRSKVIYHIWNSDIVCLKFGVYFSQQKPIYEGEELIISFVKHHYFLYTSIPQTSIFWVIDPNSSPIMPEVVSPAASPASPLPAAPLRAPLPPPLVPWGSDEGNPTMAWLGVDLGISLSSGPMIFPSTSHFEGFLIVMLDGQVPCDKICDGEVGT